MGPMQVTDSCRSESSLLMERQFNLFGSKSCVSQSCLYIRSFKIRISGEDFIRRMAAGQQSNYGPHSHTKSANAWFSTHNFRIVGDPIKQTHSSDSNTIEFAAK